MNVDFHTHILPHMDDGSSSTKESIRMIIEESLHGVDGIVLTPHFYAETMKLDHFLEKRDAMYAHMWQELKKSNSADDMTFYVGAEVCYYPGIGQSDTIENLCICHTDEDQVDDRTNVLLLELPFEQWSGQVYTDVKDLIEKKKLTVVLAHVERYGGFQKQKDVYRKVLSLPVTIQCNAGPLQKFLKRGEVLKLFKEGASLLGSDSHNMSSRMPNIGPGRKVLEQKLGEAILQKIDQTAEMLLES